MELGDTVELPKAMQNGKNNSAAWQEKAKTTSWVKL